MSKDQGWFRRVIGLMLIAAMALYLAGCQLNEPTGEAGKEEEKAHEAAVQGQTLTVLTNRVDLAEDGTFARYAERFEALHPGVSVEFEALTNYVSDIIVRMTTGNIGDVLLLPNNVTNQELPKFFEPLSNERFEKLRFADFKTYEGGRYGVATGASTEGIVYNKTAFAEAGITSVPTTLEAFYEACQKLKDAGIVPVYLNYGAQWPMKDWGEILVSYMTGDPDYLNKMVENEAPWQLDNAWGEAITIVKTLIARGYVEQDLITNNWESSKSEIASGRAAMFFSGNWVINQIVGAGASPEEIGYFPFPYNNDARHYAPLSPDWFIGVSKFSEKKALAEAWIEYFVKESGYVNDSGFLPVDQTQPSNMLQVNEFESYQPIYVESTPPTDELLEIASKAQMTFWSGDYIQEWIAAKDLAQAFEQYNQRWAEARKAVLGLPVLP
ncbi:ABC-type glycerol-3-phosphate transport system substrate-binding protein [Paenibacillus phyllosphaerae]|uniref:ABC-type glycerol-3-phosphate transport system substrate-binding protein n=1 Tax=Paenibacillus phyllosphaerae TaxID=274593 RepID=A0A7W5ATY2_9BACL|nr:ABC transporter substrate-binding protein [Paenibacillus phyllosphaerae]MBB3108724.1 ABC-type glycerol-3-phosphate transport system substrate-binding protein [Paenibacillus phyllosphaerae]